jgi:glycosyltransferase involved in cell wall biosynthesis
VWFVKNVWPQVLINHPNLRFYIVGGNPTEEVRALQQSKGVVVTGRVEDVRPFIKNAAICIAPMRIARGIQNKVLEAMAMAKPMVLTNMAADGITIPEEQEKYLADDGHSFCNGILNLLGSTQEQKLVGASNCAVIENNFKWKNTLTSLLDSFETPENKNNIPGE